MRGPVLSSHLKVLLGGAVFLLVASCAIDTTRSEQVEPDILPSFQVRSDFDAPLNRDEAWAAPLNESAIVRADEPFRIRMVSDFSVVSDPSAVLKLQYRRNEGPWLDVAAHDFPLPERTIEYEYGPGHAVDQLAVWMSPSGEALALSFNNQTDDTGAVLGGNDTPSFALHPLPWPIEGFVIAGQFRALGTPAIFDLIFAFENADNHARVRFDAENDTISIARIQAGTVEVLSRQDVQITSGDWIEAEIERSENSLTISYNDGAFEFSVLLPEDLASARVGLHASANASLEIASLEFGGEAKTPRVSIVEADAFENAAVAQPILMARDTRWANQAVPGLGLSLRETTPEIVTGDGRYREFEWPLVIRRFADGAVTNETGDEFEFRMVDARNTAVSTGEPARIVLEVPDEHLGGTYVETPGRIGPWRAQNGDLYFIMEPAETDNLFMMVKSEDGGRSWREVDALNRPQTGDLESVEGRQIGDTIHIIHQITEASVYHVFQTSDHADQPDQWVVTDELAVTAEAVAQMSSLEARSDGSLVSVFLSDRLHYVTRSPTGDWSMPIVLDPEASAITSGPQIVRGQNDQIHIVYLEADPQTQGTLWYRRLDPNNGLDTRVRLADGLGISRDEYGPVLPLVYQSETDTLTVVYRLQDGILWERQIIEGQLSAPVPVSAQTVPINPVDSQQATADLVSSPFGLHVLFADAQSGSLYSTDKCDGVWTEPVEQVGDINTSWVRGTVYPNADDEWVYGYVYDAGSNGGAGLIRYGEVKLAEVCAN